MVFATLTIVNSSPLCATAPQGAGRVCFAAARRLRAEERLQNKAGVFPPGPLQAARVGAGGRQEKSLIVTATLVPDVMPPIPHPCVFPEQTPSTAALK